jgi:hypothetical protein
MTFDCIHQTRFDPPTQAEKNFAMKADLSNNAQHQEWLNKARGEAAKRFLRLEAADSSESHWRLKNTSNETVFPVGAWAASRGSINGYFMTNPQA